jgi:hypothetical protein
VTATLAPVFTLFPDPHPELVAAQRPSPADVLEAAAYMGLFPGDEDRPDWPLLRDWTAGKAVS